MSHTIIVFSLAWRQFDGDELLGHGIKLVISFLARNKVFNVESSNKVRFLPSFVVVTINFAGPLHAQNFFTLILSFGPEFFVNFDSAQPNRSAVLSPRVLEGLKHD